MKNLIVILFSCFILSGCSLAKTLTAPFKPMQNTLPQQTDRSKAKDVCRGEAKFNEQGDMIYCSRGYYSYAENFAQKERRLTIKERIVQFFDQLSGYLFWIVILLVIFCPSLIFFIVGRIVEGTVGTASVVGKRLMRAIQKSRKDGKDLNQSLESELDEKDKKYIAKVKEQEKIK